MSNEHVRKTVSLNGYSTYDANVYIYIVIFIYGRMYSISYSYVVRLNDLLIHYIASNFVISILSLGFWTATPCCKDSDWTIFTRWNGEGIKSIWWKHRRKHFTAALTGNAREEIVSIILSRTWRVFVPKSKNMPSSGKVLRISMSNFELASLKLTAKAPENRPGPKRKGSSSNHPFSGDMLVSVSATPFLLRSCIEILSFNWCASEKTQYLAVPISQLLKFEDFSFSLWCDFKRSYKVAIFGTYETFGSSLIPLFSRFELRTTIFQARVEENGVFWLRS